MDAKAIEKYSPKCKALIVRDGLVPWNYASSLGVIVIGQEMKEFLKSKWSFGDFPGGSVVKNPPANAGDMGSSPGPGRSHMPWSNETRAPQLLSLRSRARKPQLLKPACLEPVLLNKRSHCNEKPVHRHEE